MKILLLGGNGQLGRTFLDDGGLAARGNLTAASRDGVISWGGRGEIADLSNPDTLVAVLDRVQPEIIVNAAAYTAVDRAEEEPALADRVNGEAVGVIGAWSASRGAKVIHYSTDYVFDGSQPSPYEVDAETRPLGAYGRSKLLGEKLLRDSGADHLILRTAWVYATHGQNFLRTMLRLGSDREELRVVADQHGAPTDTSLIVKGSLAALDRWTTPGENLIGGTHHLVASGGTTWHGFADAIFEQAAASRVIVKRPRVTPISSTDFPTAAMRPAWSLLDNSEFQQKFQFSLPDWQSGLKRIISEMAHSAN